MARVKVKIEKENHEEDEPVTSAPDADTQAQPVEPQEPSSQPASPSQPQEAPQPPAVNQPPHRVLAIPKQVAYLAAAIVVLLIILLVVNSRDSQAPAVNNSGNTVENTTEDLGQKYHDKIKNLLELPSDKPLEFAEVKDAKKLAEKKPELFKKAQDGDAVLFYSNPDKSLLFILFRPSTEKIITYIDGINQNAASTNQNNNNN